MNPIAALRLDKDDTAVSTHFAVDGVRATAFSWGRRPTDNDDNDSSSASTFVAVLTETLQPGRKFRAVLNRFDIPAHGEIGEDLATSEAVELYHFVTPDIQLARGGPEWCVEVGPSARAVAVTSRHAVEGTSFFAAINASNGKLIKRMDLEKNQGASSLAFSPDERFCALGSINGSVLLLNSRSSFTHHSLLQLHGHEITSIRFSPAVSCCFLVSLSANGGCSTFSLPGEQRDNSNGKMMITKDDVDNGEAPSVSRIDVPRTASAANTERFVSVDLSNDGRILVIASVSCLIFFMRSWSSDSDSWTCARTVRLSAFLHHGRFVMLRNAQFSPNSAFVVCRSASDDFLLVSSQTGTVYTMPRGHSYCPVVVPIRSPSVDVGPTRRRGGNNHHCHIKAVSRDGKENTDSTQQQQQQQQQHQNEEAAAAQDDCKFFRVISTGKVIRAVSTLSTHGTGRFVGYGGAGCCCWTGIGGGSDFNMMICSFKQSD